MTIVPCVIIHTITHDLSGTVVFNLFVKHLTKCLFSHGPLTVRGENLENLGILYVYRILYVEFIVLYVNFSFWYRNLEWKNST